MSERSSNPKRISGSTPYRGYERLLTVSSKEFGTTYTDVLRTVVPTGVGCAVLPTVSGMHPAVNRTENAVAAYNAILSLMFQPRLGYGWNLDFQRSCVFT